MVISMTMEDNAIKETPTKKSSICAENKSGISAEKNSSFCAGIIGTGICLPQKIMTNFDMEKIVDTTNEWIVQRSGIHERRILEKDESIEPLALKASVEAIRDAGIEPSEIDMIIATSSTPEHLSPTLSAVLQHGIGVKNCAAFDLNAACTGFIYALSIAETFIKNGAYKYILITSSESVSKAVDWENRSTCVLFGDGVGAAVVGRVDDGYGVIRSILGADGEGSGLISIPCTYVSQDDIEKRKGKDSRTVYMDGGKVLKFASKIMTACVDNLITMEGISLKDIKLLIPHQANLRIIDNSIRKIGIEQSRVFVNIDKYGNTSSASVPIALHEATKAGMLSDGDYYIVVAFGGGLTYGAHLCRWRERRLEFISSGN